MKKTFLLSLLIVVALFSACSNSSSSEKADNPLVPEGEFLPSNQLETAVTNLCNKFTQCGVAAQISSIDQCRSPFYEVVRRGACSEQQQIAFTQCVEAKSCEELKNPQNIAACRKQACPDYKAFEGDIPPMSFDSTNAPASSQPATEAAPSDSAPAENN